jgi:hypothetical protein
MRLDEPSRFAATGKAEPSTRSKSRAGPCRDAIRETISQISKRALTGTRTRASSPASSRIRR